MSDKIQTIIKKRVWITWIKIEGHWRKKVNKFNLRMLHELSDLNIIGRTDAEAETPILWPPDVKN